MVAFVPKKEKEGGNKPGLCNGPTVYVFCASRSEHFTVFVRLVTLHLIHPTLLSWTGLYACECVRACVCSHRASWHFSQRRVVWGWTAVSSYINKTKHFTSDASIITHCTSWGIWTFAQVKQRNTQWEGMCNKEIETKEESSSFVIIASCENTQVGRRWLVGMHPHQR